MAQALPRTAQHDRPRNPVGLAVRLVAGALLTVGVLGFVPGITAGDEGLAFVGRESTALLFGVFQVSVLGNVVHLLLGVFGLAMALPVRAAVVYLFWGGIALLLLWGYGVAVDFDSSANVVPFNAADNWLHLILGAGMAGLAVAIRSTHGSTGEKIVKKEEIR